MLKTHPPGQSQQRLSFQLHQAQSLSTQYLWDLSNTLRLCMISFIQTHNQPLTVFTVWGNIYTLPSPHSSFNLYSPSDSPRTKFFSRKLHSFSLWEDAIFLEKWGTSTDGFCGSPLNHVLLMGSEMRDGENTEHKPASPATLFSTVME